jgi:hypothetical protein
MITAALAVPLTFLWATVGSAGVVWIFAGICAQDVSGEEGRSHHRGGEPARWWESTRASVFTGLSYFGAWIALYLETVFVGFPTALRYVHQGSSIALRPDPQVKAALVVASVLIGMHCARRRREALQHAQSGVFDFVVPGETAWRGFARLTAQQAAGASCRRSTVEIRWPAGSIAECDRGATIAMCHVLQEDGPMAGSMGLTVTAVTAFSLANSAVSSQQPWVLLVVALEFVLLLVLSASEHLSLGRFLTRIPRSERVSIHIIACLSTAPESLGDGDPLASHRGPLEAIVRDFRVLARASEDRARYREAVDPYPLVLRGAARYLARYLGSRESATGRKPESLILLLRRSLTILEGNADALIIQRVARTIGAYNEDGSPDADLVVRSQRWAVRWGRALPAHIDQVRATSSSLAAILLMVSGVVLLLAGHVGVDSLPSFVK